LSNRVNSIQMKFIRQGSLFIGSYTIPTLKSESKK